MAVEPFPVPLSGSTDCAGDVDLNRTYWVSLPTPSASGLERAVDSVTVVEGGNDGDEDGGGGASEDDPRG